MAREKPLLAGLVAGFALVYDATIAAPFWAILILAVFFDTSRDSLSSSSLCVCWPIWLSFSLGWSSLRIF